MHNHTPTTMAAEPVSGPNSPSSNAGPEGAACPSVSTMVRVGRVLRDMAAARSISDAEIRQHAADCTFLMESAYDRFQDCGDITEREAAYLWMHRRDEALRSLSPEFKAAREREIQQAIAAGTGCYFIDQADADRRAMAGRAAG